MSQYVVWFDSAETGAPVLNNAAGSLIAVLDACLITGFNLKSVTSLVVAGGVATATCAGHGFSGTHGKDLLIAGSTPGGLNGRKALTYVDTNTFKFDATGIADQTATGTITAKRDPLGWVKQFTGTNKAIYKRSDPVASSMMLRVLDTAAAPATTTDARVLMVESATDADTYTGPGPTSAHIADANGQYWNKGSNLVSAKQWSIVGSATGFFLVTPNGNNVLPTASLADAAALHAFFDFPSLKAGDGYGTVLSGPVASVAGGSAASALGKSEAFVTGDASLVIARAHTQVGGAVKGNCTGIGTGVSGASAVWAQYPNPVDNGLLIFPSILLTEENGSAGSMPRGTIPGICQVLGRAPFKHYQIVESVNALPGRKLLALNHGVNGTGGVLLFDLTGPWGA